MPDRDVCVAAEVDDAVAGGPPERAVVRRVAGDHRAVGRHVGGETLANDLEGDLTVSVGGAGGQQD
jgi:hypothetical protein